MSFGVNVAYHSRSSPRWGAKVRISVLSICWTRAYPVGIRPFNDLTQYLRKQSNYPIAHGGFGDIWKCSLPDEVRRCWLSTYSLQSLTCRNLLHRQNVAVKAIRSYFIDENDRIKKDKASTFVLRKINTWCWFASEIASGINHMAKTYPRQHPSIVWRCSRIRSVYCHGMSMGEKWIPDYVSWVPSRPSDSRTIQTCEFIFDLSKADWDDPVASCLMSQVVCTIVSICPEC